MSFVSDPVKYGAVIIPSDVTDLTSPTRGIWVGTTGNISVKLANSEALIFQNVPVGILPVQALRINSAGTTASNLVALW
jgi:hypothetical protein